MTRLWSEDYMSEDSDDDTYGPRPSVAETTKTGAPTEMDSVSVLAEGARLTCCPGAYGAGMQQSRKSGNGDPTSSTWLPDCCTGRAGVVSDDEDPAGGNKDATARGGVESAPTWGSFTTTGDQTEKQAAAFAASVEQTSREVAESDAAKGDMADVPLLNSETRLSDEDQNAGEDGDEADDEQSLEVARDGTVQGSVPLDQGAEETEDRSTGTKNAARTRTGFGLVMASMFAARGLGSIGSSKKEMLAKSEDSQDLVAQDADAQKAISNTASTEWTPDGPVPQSMDNDVAPDDLEEANVDMRSAEAADVHQQSAGEIDDATNSRGGGLSDLVPAGDEKDLESGVGSTMNSAYEDETVEDEEALGKGSRRRRPCCYCCLLLLCFIFMGGLGAFFVTGYKWPGFLRREDSSSSATAEALDQNGNPLPPTPVDANAVPGADGEMPPPPNEGADGEVQPPPVDETDRQGTDPNDPEEEGSEDTEGPGAGPGRGPPGPDEEGDGEENADAVRVRFGVLADIPFDDRQANDLEGRLEGADADFILHVGNVRDDDPACTAAEFTRAAAALASSEVPVWVLPGPNDWTVCDNLPGAQAVYRNTFLQFTENNWNVTQPFRQPNRPHNFAWQASSNLLVIGLNFISERPGTTDEIFAWIRAVAENFGGERIVIASYDIPQEFVALVDTLGLPDVLYISTSYVESGAGSATARATSRLTYGVL